MRQREFIRSGGDVAARGALCDAGDDCENNRKNPVVTVWAKEGGLQAPRANFRPPRSKVAGNAFIPAGFARFAHLQKANRRPASYTKDLADFAPEITPPLFRLMEL
jgi:hypothetical protein